MSDPAKKSNIPVVVAEENALLDHVGKHLRRGQSQVLSSANYDEELISLRDAIAEARPEDIPPLVEQMTRVQSLAAQRGLGDEIPVDPKSPYFGHLRLNEDENTRDVLLGKHTYLSQEEDIRIVDWRNAPVSRMYYSYDEEDDYEEVFGGRMRRGTVSARRSVTIIDSELRRVSSQQGLFVQRKGHWVELDSKTSSLAGGQGTSIRAEGLSPVRGKLGVDADGSDRKDKHLPEIAALLDKNQFDLISSSAAGLVVVQGGAGSGKTTVGLHRIAYLAYQEPQRFRSHRILVVVFNEGLAAYISQVLPALGVHGVRVTTFKEWASFQRRKHVQGLPTLHSDETPLVVSRLKKHPAMLGILNEIIDRQDEQLTERLFDTVAGTPDEARVQTAWNVLQRYPLDARRIRMMRWLDGGVRIGRDRGKGIHQRTVAAGVSALNRLERQASDVITDWADLFTDREALSQAFEMHAPGEFSDSELEMVHNWCVDIYKGLDKGSKDDPPVIDQEDEAILLRLYQLKRGWLKIRSSRLIYNHIMIDETQDFSPLEVAVLMETIQKGQPITFAGDTAQKIVRDSGFVSWNELLGDLGLSGSRIAPLKIAYRSTIEIMRLSRDILGPYAGEPQQAHRHGAEVELHCFSDPGQAVGFLGSALRELAIREPRSNVAVITRYPSQAKTYYDGLKKSEIPGLKLVADEDFSFKPGVEVTDVYQVKGLEFDYVILAEVNAESYPDTEESRHLLHVGSTRAAHQLWLFTTGTPSSVLPDWLVDKE